MLPGMGGSTRQVAVIAAVVLLVPAAGAAAQAPPLHAAQAPQVGSTDGVKAVTSHGKVVFVFTSSAKKLWKRVAGRAVAIDCEQTPIDTPGSGPTHAQVQALKAPKKGMKLATGVRAGRYDLCVISVERKNGDQVELVDVALTQQGATFEDERLFASDLLSIVNVADSMATAGHFPPAAQVVPKFNGAAVELAAPTDTPPAGKYGFYSDGNQHVAAVVLSSAGRRLFFEISGDTVSTNVLAQINSLG
jgi:hypothetical protein